MSEERIIAPFVSVNKLGEFVYATDAKKRNIVKTNKYPSTFIHSRYNTPRSALVHFMEDAEHDAAIFMEKRNLVSQRKEDTDWKKGNKVCCLQALDNLLAVAGTTLVPYFRYISQRDVHRKYKEYKIGNVSVHLNPDVLLLDSTTKQIKGAVKLIFSKSRAVTFQEGEISAGLIKTYIEKVHNVRLKPADCVAVDVFKKTVIIAPEDFSKYSAKVRRACKEIEEMWETISK